MFQLLKLTLQTLYYTILNTINTYYLPNTLTVNTFISKIIHFIQTIYSTNETHGNRTKDPSNEIRNFAWNGMPRIRRFMRNRRFTFTITRKLNRSVPPSILPRTLMPRLFYTNTVVDDRWSGFRRTKISSSK